jgi:hypothetical protein
MQYKIEQLSLKHELDFYFIEDKSDISNLSSGIYILRRQTGNAYSDYVYDAAYNHDNKFYLIASEIEIDASDIAEIYTEYAYLGDGAW